MTQPSLIHDLYAHNDWANEKLITMAVGLSDEKLDAQQPMGFGSLRATLHHMAFAERLWLDRWKLKPWTPLSFDSANSTLEYLSDTLLTTAKERNELLDRESCNQFSRMVVYRNTANEPYRHRLRELLVHVSNHAIYHRAQALNFLRLYDCTVKGGLDYLFYKMARPTVAQEAASIDSLQKRGVELGATMFPAPMLDADVIRRYCQYGNWAMDAIVALSESLSDQELDRKFEMGLGTLRKSLHHVCAAEQWWYRNWTVGSSKFPELPQDLPIASFVEIWKKTVSERDQFLADKSSDDLAHQVTANPGGAPVHFRLGESVIQLCGHGTHHRAQCVNMLRRLGLTAPPSDYVAWIRGVGALVD